MKSAQKFFVLLVLVNLFNFVALAAGTKIKATNEQYLIDAANVDYVEYIKGQDKDMKIFSVSGGDPAMNGAHLNIAVYVDLDTGWKVYELANVRDYKLLPSAKKGYLKFDLTRDDLDQDGNFKTIKSKLYVNVTQIENGVIEIEELK